MRVLMRLLLVWLLVLCVPAKGLAAASMALCKLHQGGVAAVAAAPHLHAAQDSHPMNGAHDMGSGDQDVDAAHPCAGADPGGAHKSGAHQCSACAACCSVAALPNPVLTVPAAELVPTRFGAVVASVGIHAVGGPDRPPRPVLA